MDHGWIIPIWSPAGPLLGWQYKRLDIVANWPKKVKKSETLFGLRELREIPATAHAVAIVESPLDVVRLASAGVTAPSSPIDLGVGPWRVS